MATRHPKTYQIKIGLMDAKPPIWRRVLIADSVPLPTLHEVIQTVMGWDNYHLHQFRAGGIYYGTPDPEFDMADIRDESRYRLNQLLKQEKDSLIYEYDFGDSWEHKITLEKVLPFDPADTLPRCIKGKGACPPEDVGGIFGYYGFLDAVRDTAHPEHQEMLEWIGGEFDPDDFDLEEVNALLSEQFR
jgi:hypothetical protein